MVVPLERWRVVFRFLEVRPSRVPDCCRRPAACGLEVRALTRVAPRANHVGAPQVSACRASTRRWRCDRNGWNLGSSVWTASSLFVRVLTRHPSPCAPKCPPPDVVWFHTLLVHRRRRCCRRHVRRCAATTWEGEGKKAESAKQALSQRNSHESAKRGAAARESAKARAESAKGQRESAKADGCSCED